MQISRGDGRPGYRRCMSRPPRPRIAGALYHVTARGNRKADIFLDEQDYACWLELFGQAVQRFALVCHGFCQMPNHFHLLLQTPAPNISEAMHFLNCAYACAFNRRHELDGHVLQGRFHSVLVEEESHFLELTRYIALNPVRARLVPTAAEWRWSHYRFTAGLECAPPWLQTEATLSRFAQVDEAARQQAFRSFVAAGVGGRNPLAPPKLPEPQSCKTAEERDAAIGHAMRSGHFTARQLAEHFSLSLSTVHRIAGRGRDYFSS